MRYVLPSWCELSTSDSTKKYAVLKGTPTDGGTKHAFTLKVTDSRGNTGARDFVLPVTLPLTVTGKLPSGVRRNVYAGNVRANGGFAPYKWSVSSGALPDGLNVKASGDFGVISGTPSKAGQYSFTLKATDSNGMTFEQAMSVKITQTKITGTLYDTTRRSEYSGKLRAVEGTEPYTWSVSSGKLPDGLTLSASGDISGTAIKAGTFKFTIKAKDSNGAAGTKDYTVKVTQTTLSGTIPTTTTRRATYTGSPKVTGGATPYKWTISAGKLPNGLKINASTGKITGSATKAGTYKFTVKAKDTNGAASTKDYTVKVTQTTLAGNIPASTTRRANYIGTPKVTGGASPYKWTISSGKLPDGLKINASTGKITGNPTKAGTYKFTVKAKDSNGAASTKDYTVKVTQTTLTGNILTSTTRRASYTGTLKATGGASPYVWGISAGKLPDGLKLNTSTGKITGTATKAGTFNFTVKAKDSNGAASSKAYTVTVTQTKVTGTLSNGTKSTSYTATPKASGGTSPYVWSVSAGNLPTGLKLDTSSGKISGTPTKSGSFTFTLKAKDKNGAAGTKSFTVKISEPTTKSALPEIKTDTQRTYSNSDSAQAHGIVSSLLPAMTDDTDTENHSQPVIVARLGEISCDVAGMYDFDVELSDNATIGAKLVYMANSDKPSDDDGIAEFYDDTGKEISDVPENRQITISIWLNPETIYHPEIAIR